jgi:Tfp pilus assembly PilM family ATPase
LEPSEPLTTNEAARLLEALGRQGFAGRDLVLSAPHDAVLSGMIELPPSVEDVPLEKLARVEFARINRIESNQFEMACWPLPSGPRGGARQAMAVGCLHERSHVYMNHFESAGWRVRAIDTGANAAARAIEPLVKNHDDITGLIDIGWSGAQMVVLHQGVAIYSRMLNDMGLAGVHALLRRRGDFDVAVADWLLETIGLAGPDTPGLDDRQRSCATEVGAVLGIYTENLANHIGAALNYAEHRYPDARVQDLFVSGGGALTRGLVEHLGHSLDTRVSMAIPSGLTMGAEVQDSISPVTLGAYGLACYREDKS